jgi:hypothetical protein
VTVGVVATEVVVAALAGAEVARDDCVVEELGTAAGAVEEE